MIIALIFPYLFLLAWLIFSIYYQRKAFTKFEESIVPEKYITQHGEPPVLYSAIPSRDNWIQEILMSDRSVGDVRNNNSTLHNKR